MVVLKNSKFLFVKRRCAKQKREYSIVLGLWDDACTERAKRVVVPALSRIEGLEPVLGNKKAA